jgi:hypothetical protein
MARGEKVKFVVACPEMIQFYQKPLEKANLYLIIFSSVGPDMLIDDVLTGVHLLPVSVATLDAHPTFVLGVETEVTLQVDKCPA